MKKIQNKPQATNTHKTILASIFAFIALSVLYLLVTASMRGTIAPTRDTQEQAPTSSQAKVIDTTSKDGMKTFRSDFMKIEFEYPERYRAAGNLNFVDLCEEKDTKTCIGVSMVGSQFKNTNEHINNLISKNSLLHYVIEDKYFGNVLWQKAMFKVDSRTEIIYFYVYNYASYQISTKDPTLFPDLETIAKSFRILE